MLKPKLIVLTGPTATGKSALGVSLAKKIGGEIVSADSMQVYKHMDIGTAKPTADEMLGVRHHMIDIVRPWEDYSVARYVEDASKCVDDILRSGKQPIIVGGTGLYIDSLLKGRLFPARGQNDQRRELEEEYDNIGGLAMLLKLRLFDAESAAKLHKNDKKRIVRAFEAFKTTNKPISLHDKESKEIPQRYKALKVALNFAERSKLYQRIDDRVDEMMIKGLENEVKALLSMNVSRSCTSMQAIGYKEISGVILGKPDTGGVIDMSEAVDKIKMESRRYAKRQLTWLRRDDDVKWLTWENTPDMDYGLAEIMKII